MRRRLWRCGALVRQRTAAPVWAAADRLWTLTPAERRPVWVRLREKERKVRSGAQKKERYLRVSKCTFGKANFDVDKTGRENARFAIKFAFVPARQRSGTQ